MKNSRKTVFVIDDQPVFANVLKSSIEGKRTNVQVFYNGEDALASNVKPDIILLDFELDDGSGTNKNGIAILREFKAKYPEVEVIMISGHEDINIATKSIKFGAYDYVVKNEAAIVNLKNKMKNVIRKINILSEVVELQKMKRTVGSIAVAAGIFAFVMNFFTR